MTKMIFIPVFLLLFLKVQSQDSVKLFYISKITTSEKDSVQLAQCQNIEYRGATVKLLFLKNGIRIDSFSTSTTTYTKLEDSVILDILISQQLYDKSDSIVISPIHRFSCKGVRGGLFVEGEGKEIKN